MNPDPDQLRRLVRSARPSGVDDADEEVAAALEALRGDPAFEEAWRAEREIDRSIAGEVQGTEPPPGLEDRLIRALREARAGGQASAGGRDDGKAAPISRRRWLGLGLAAAGAAAVGGILYGRKLGRLPFDTLTGQLARISRDGVTLSLMSMDRDEVVSWLLDRKAPRAEVLPDGLDALPRKGCHVYEIEDHEVSLECFLLPGMRELHLFTTPAAGLSGEPVAYGSVAGLSSAGWTRGSQTMVMLSEVPAAELREVLG